MRSRSVRPCLTSRYSTPRKFSGTYSWISSALTITKSPSVIECEITPPVARHSSATRLPAMISCWPVLSIDSVACDFICAER